MAGLLQVMLHRGLRFRDYAEVIETLISWRVLRDGSESVRQGRARAGVRATTPNQRTADHRIVKQRHQPNESRFTRPRPSARYAIHRFLLFAGDGG
jgi:hypothetical protein